jgi:uncharacterized membrane protein YoaT (DUF817 family)
MMALLGFIFVALALIAYYFSAMDRLDKEHFKYKNCPKWTYPVIAFNLLLGISIICFIFACVASFFIKLIRSLST